VRRAPRATARASPTDLTTRGTDFFDFASDAARVYTARGIDGLVVRTTKVVGGAIETLASGQAQPLALAVNSRAVYWLNANGAVMTVRKP
jgi:hypothetical protein